MANNDNKKKNDIGFAIWLVAALIVFIVFLVSRERMLTVLKETDFFNKVFGSEPQFITNFEPKHTESQKAETEITEEIILENINSSNQNKITLNVDNNKINDSSVDATVKDSAEKSVEIPQSKVETPISPVKTEEKAEIPKKVETQNAVSESKMKQTLFFIVISGDGSVVRKEITREIPKTNTPLTAAINALLSGPNISELESGYMSLIPNGTKLLGASINNGVATINFSEEFLFNKYGVEGIYGQLMQVVYTATAFSNIDSVQFLIEGAKQEYLGEGIFVGSPLPRSAFK